MNTIAAAGATMRRIAGYCTKQTEFFAQLLGALFAVVSLVWLKLVQFVFGKMILNFVATFDFFLQNILLIKQ